MAKDRDAAVVLDDEEISIRPGRGPKAKPQANQSAGLDGYDFADDELVEESESPTTVPVIKGAKVVYLGHQRNKCVPLIGRLFVEDIYADEPVECPECKGGVEPPRGIKCRACGGEGRFFPKIDEVKTASLEGGMQAYDFTTHDIKGRPIRQGRMPLDAPPEVAGRRYAIVEHAEHLRQFLRMRDANGQREFRVLVPKKWRRLFDEYVYRVERAEGAQQRLLHRTTSDVE